MGRRGPRPKPRESHERTGSKSKYKRKGEPGLVAGEPEPPEWLDERASRQWRVMVDRLRGMQVLSASFRESLAMYCEAWSEYEGLVIECQSHDQVVIGKSGAPYQNPLFSAKNRAWDRVMKIGKEFGFTPAAKADIRVESEPQGNDKSKFFRVAG